MSSKTKTLIKIRENFSSFEEIWLFTQIFILVTLLPVMLKLLSIPKLLRILTPQDVKVYKDMDPAKSKDRIVKFTDYILSRNFWIYKNTCLKRSLVIYHFLRKLGINVHLCFGVRYNGKLPDREAEKKLEGHAWLLYNRDVFLERNTDVMKTYKMTYCFPEKKEK